MDMDILLGGGLFVCLKGGWFCVIYEAVTGKSTGPVLTRKRIVLVLAILVSLMFPFEAGVD